MGRKSNAREKLIVAASEAIANSNSHAVSVDALCRQANVNKGSFYHFFQSKQDVVLNVLDYAWNEVLEKQLIPAFSPKRAPLERIRAYYLASYEHHANDKRTHGYVRGCPFLNLGTELSTLSESARERVESIHTRYRAYYIKSLEEAASQGDFRGNAEQVGRILFCTLNGLVADAKISNDPEIIRSHIPTAMAIVTHT